MSLRYCIPAARTQCPQAGRPSNNRSFCARLPQGQTNFDHAPPFGNLRCTTATTNSTPLSPLSNRMVAALVSGPISPIACNRDARTTGLRLDDCPFCWAAGRRCDDAEFKKLEHQLNSGDGSLFDLRQDAIETIVDVIAGSVPLGKFRKPAAVNGQEAGGAQGRRQNQAGEGGITWPSPTANSW